MTAETGGGGGRPPRFGLCAAARPFGGSVTAGGWALRSLLVRQGLGCPGIMSGRGSPGRGSDRVGRVSSQSSFAWRL